MTDETKDPLQDALKAAPPVDVDPWRREHVRLRAQRELARDARPGRLAVVYTRLLEPIGVATVSGGWLFWALRRVWMIYAG